MNRQPLHHDLAEAPPATTELTGLPLRMRDAALAARAKGQGLFRYSLTPADWKLAAPYLAPTANPGVAMCGPVPVHYARFGQTSRLWVRANDGQLGNLLGVAL